MAIKKYYLQFLCAPTIEAHVEFVCEFGEYKIFEIKTSKVAKAGVSVQLRGQTIGVYHHFAVNKDGQVCFFDNEKKQVLGRLAECKIATSIYEK